MKALLALVLLAAAPPAPRAPEPTESPAFHWPDVKVVEYVEASEITEAAGVPVALRGLVTKERIPDLLQRFANAFRAGNLFIPAGPKQPQLAKGAVMLTALDVRRNISYTAIFQPNADGSTTVYLGEANHALRRDPAAAGDFAPLPPGARSVVRVNGEGARTLAFHVPLSEQDVNAFYTKELTRLGWHRVEEEPSLYTRASEELRLIHQSGADGLRAVVLVLRDRLAEATGAAGPK